MALKNTQKPITMAEYNKKMDKIIDTDLPVHEKLIELLNEARKYRIVEANKTKHISHKGKKAKKLKIYHDITCNCYDCRAGLSLRAKD